jgi:hypothetical protein
MASDRYVSDQSVLFVLVYSFGIVVYGRETNHGTIGAAATNNGDWTVRSKIRVRFVAKHDARAPNTNSIGVNGLG